MLDLYTEREHIGNGKGNKMNTRILMTLCAWAIGFAGVWTSADEPRKVCNDFDGDGRTDPAIYCPASGIWTIFQTSSSTLRTEHLGSGSCLPVPGDYDGDGKTDLMVFDSTTGNWYFKLDNGDEGMGNFGLPGMWPVPADYDGDRITDPAVYDPQTGIWTIILTKSQTIVSGKWGYLGDFRSWENPRTYTVMPMPFDYNQDGVDDLAVYYRGLSMADSGWTILYVGVGDTNSIWGSSGSLPAPGYYQERPADSLYPSSLCVYKIIDASWAIPYRSAFYMGVYKQTLPVPAGDYDGNGFDDNTVYNYVTGEWTIVLNTGTADVVDRERFNFFFGGPDAVPANIYSTIYALARYSPKPW